MSANGYVESSYNGGVAPFAGAWIETVRVETPIPTPGVGPLHRDPDA